LGVLTVVGLLTGDAAIDQPVGTNGRVGHPREVYKKTQNPHDWLVVEPTPLKNMSLSVGIIIPPNHQPDDLRIMN